MKGVPLNEELYNYILNLFVKEDEVLIELVKEQEKESIPMIQISPDTGKLLYLLVKILNAKTILEIGTLAGYSAIWMARALPDDGKLITIEISDKHFEFAEKQFEKAGLINKIEMRKGTAIDILRSMENYNLDLVFMDADKENGLNYYNLLKPIMNTGGIIVIDNALRDGMITSSDVDSGTRGMQVLNEVISKDPSVDSLLLSIADGLTLARFK